MTQEDVIKSVKTGRIHDRSFRFEKLGSLLVIAICTVFAGLCIAAFLSDFIKGKDLTYLLFLVSVLSGICAFFLLRGHLREDLLTCIPMGLGYESNRRIVIESLQELGWEVSVQTKYSIVSTIYLYQTYIAFTWLDINFFKQKLTILFHNDCVYLNIRFLGTSKGRFSTFFGVKEKMLTKLQQKIMHKKQIASLTKVYNEGH
jgi:hypothetical protein